MHSDNEATITTEVKHLMMMQIMFHWPWWEGMHNKDKKILNKDVYIMYVYALEVVVVTLAEEKENRWRKGKR